MNQYKIEFPALMKSSLKCFLDDIHEIKTYLTVEFEKSENDKEILVIKSDQDITDVNILILSFKYGWFSREVIGKVVDNVKISLGE